MRSPWHFATIYRKVYPKYISTYSCFNWKQFSLHSILPLQSSPALYWFEFSHFRAKKRIRLGEEPSVCERKPWRNGRLGKVDLKKWKRLKNAAERWKVCWTVTWVSNWVELMPITDAGLKVLARCLDKTDQVWEEKEEGSEDKCNKWTTINFWCLHMASVESLENTSLCRNEWL